MNHVKFLKWTILSFFLVACGQNNDKKGTVDKNNESPWKALSQNGYTVKYPGSWSLNKTGEMGSEFMILSQRTSKNDFFKENVNMIIQNLAGKNIDLNEYVKISERQILDMLVDGRLIESSRHKNHNSEFHKLIYYSKVNSKTIKVEQYLWVKKEKAYVLTLCCEMDEFEKYKKTGEEILNSFSFD